MPVVQMKWSNRLFYLLMRRCLTGLLIAFVLAGSFGTAGYLVRDLIVWRRLYNEAEPLLPVANEFAAALDARLKGENRREVKWTDLTELLAEERFAPLRDRSFVPASQPGVMVTLRVNDGYEFPLEAGGYARFVFRESTG